MTQSPAQPAKVFAFPGARASEPPARQPAAAPPQAAPAAHAPEPEPVPEPEAEAAAVDELGFDHPTADETSDELLLGEVDILGEEAAGDPAAQGGNRSWIGQEEEEPAAPARPAQREGGTLFERMSSIARGAAKAQVEEEGPRMRRDRDSLDIPRFLNRQNNQ